MKMDRLLFIKNVFKPLRVSVLMKVKPFFKNYFDFL